MGATRKITLARLITVTATTVLAFAGSAGLAMADTPSIVNVAQAEAMPAPTKDASTTGGGSVLAAFGDSFSAGEGTNSYLPGTDLPGTNMCHRSTLAYSQLLAKDLGITSEAFDACSGGVTADLFAPNNNANLDANGVPESAQLCQTDSDDGIQACTPGREPALGPNTKYVALTIGGNDAGLAKVVQSCVFGSVDGHLVGLPGRGCRYDAATVEHTAARIAALAGVGKDTSPYGSDVHPISQVLAAIHQVAPNAHVDIAGYPRVFQPTVDHDCVVGSLDAAGRAVPLQIAPDDAKTLDDTADALDDVIRSAAQKDSAWASYVDPVPAFTGHGLCTDSSWINQISATATVDLDNRTLDLSLDKGSLHPSVRGQAGYESAFLASVKPRGLAMPCGRGTGPRTRW